MPAILVGDRLDLQVMSFNLRYANAFDAQSWKKRRPVAAKLIEQESPAVIGTQEGLVDQLEQLIEDTPERFCWVGEGREGGDNGEFTAVIYDNTRVDPQSVDVFWLSETPDRAGSKSWGSRHPRMTTLVKFVDLLTGVPFTFINTHLDYRSEKARVHSVEMLLEKVREANEPTIVTGDFNVDDESPIHAQLTAHGSPLQDAWLNAAEHIGPAYGTFHAYRGLVENGKRIDWILTTDHYVPTQAAVNPFGEGGQFPSDHLPVQVLLRLRG
ncbi:endonuclease/exonuclease/phosphatase family protein [Saxibacter everestensis]|uniref:Endonuclease/exonuclease/phosphatase family protein n=1 Tax=Saxibacter everestensis TaxID=2909229 RepID=A0ABY8QZI5_9MICO|nr:endonuclease/exonuclease/phosphatase family protein [Brevibacteriaceae bacterium ZFBP1038]